jgi:hypothetical protein
VRRRSACEGEQHAARECNSDLAHRVDCRIERDGGDPNLNSETGERHTRRRAKGRILGGRVGELGDRGSAVRRASTLPVYRERGER